MGVVGIFVFSRLESFLIRDAHFTIPEPKNYGEESDNIHIQGLKHGSRARIRQLFARDIGRSLYLFPTAERRRNLLAIDWVKDASVERIWPNEVRVRITERTPVAFVPAGLTGDGAQRFSLMDEEGRLLNVYDKATFQLPVLTGLGPELDAESRKDRVRRVMRLLTELGPLSEKLSEIDVGHPESLRVTLESAGRAVTLILGSENFKARLKNFLDNRDDVLRRLPGATVFDLRLEDRITATELKE
jgi:cell division protein FtsQ